MNIHLWDIFPNKYILTFRPIYIFGLSFVWGEKVDNTLLMYSSSVGWDLGVEVGVHIHTHNVPKIYKNNITLRNQSMVD